MTKNKQPFQLTVMMMTTSKPKIAIITDLHFGVSNFSKPIFEEQMKFFEKQFFPYILENDIKNVLCCADFFHSREKIDWYILDQIRERFFEWFENNNVIFHCIVGNHDTYFKSTIKQNSLSKTAENYKNVIIYDETTIKEIEKYTIGFVPWIIDTKKYTFPKKCDIIIAHLELRDFPMMKGILSKDGYDHTQFESYKYVFSGHYHINSRKDNVIMVGTPYQLTWNDFNTNKGFYVLDNNFGIKYIENTVNPKFTKLYYDNGIILVDGLGDTKNITLVESIEVAKNNYCRIYVKKADDQLALETYQSSLLSVSCNDYKIELIHLSDVVENFDSDSFDEKFENEESTMDLIIACIEDMTFEAGIDNQKLIKFAQEEYKLACDEANGLGEE